MPRINRLDPALVNKIAAGEVIERPASVVKELLENAIDAGATRIDIALEEGGARLIRVTDNGGGIEPDDLPLAIAAHATSKITHIDDLFRIGTLGFRGEALASIASISRLTIRSRTADRDEGHEIVAVDDVPVEVAAVGPLAGRHPNPLRESPLHASPCAAPKGTTVEVRNLFYNVPARRKFLRHAPAELGHVTEQLARLSLAHPAVAFSLSHNGRSVRDLPATADRRTRIADFYGPELADCLIPLSRNERGLDIAALIAPPAQSRATAKWQYIFLNGRFIVDRRLAFAVREAYRGLMEPGRFPVVFIFLNTAPDQFDVNVHPTKIEVRWRDAGLIQSQVLAVLRETLLSRDLTPSLAFGAGAATDHAGDSREPPPAGQPPEHASGVRRAIADYLRSIDPTQARLRFEPPRFASPQVRPSLASDYAGVVRIDSDAEFRTESTTDRLHQSDVEGAIVFPTGDSSAPDAPGAATENRTASPSDRPARIRMHGDDAQSPDHGSAPDAAPGASHPDALEAPAIQIHNTYLVAQTDQGVIIVDQHALHERILYEKFRRRILAGPLESQRLLIPETLGASPAQTEAATDHADLLASLGLEITAFGPRTLAVQAVPSLLPNMEIKTFVGDLLDRLAEVGHVESPETLVHAALDMMACKAAVKAGDPLSGDEIRALLAQRHLIDKSSSCPHGRPTTLQLSTRDLEKLFKRT